MFSSLLNLRQYVGFVLAQCCPQLMCFTHMWNNNPHAQGALCVFTKNLHCILFFVLFLNIQVLFGVNIINMFKASYCFQYKFLYIVSVWFSTYFSYCNKSNFHCFFDFVCFGSKFAKLFKLSILLLKHSTKKRPKLVMYVLPIAINWYHSFLLSLIQFYMLKKEKNSKKNQRTNCFCFFFLFLILNP